MCKTTECTEIDQPRVDRTMTSHCYRFTERSKGSPKLDMNSGRTAIKEGNEAKKSVQQQCTTEQPPSKDIDNGEKAAAVMNLFGAATQRRKNRTP